MPTVKTARQNNNSVLFTFDSIVDLPLGVTLALKRALDALGPDAFSLFDVSFLQKSSMEHMKARQETLGVPFFELCFSESGKKSADAIYKSYTMDTGYDKKSREISPVTNALRLVHAFCNHSDNSIKVFLLGRCQLDIEILKGIFQKRCKNIIYLMSHDLSDIDINNYGRIVIGDVHQLDSFNPPKLRHITILNYGSNLQLVNGKPNLLPEYVIKYGDVNELEMLNAYDL